MMAEDHLRTITINEDIQKIDAIQKSNKEKYSWTKKETTIVYEKITTMSSTASQSPTFEFISIFLDHSSKGMYVHTNEKRSKPHDGLLLYSCIVVKIKRVIFKHDFLTNVSPQF